MTTFSAPIHVVKNASDAAPEISEVLGVIVTPEQVEAIKTLLFGEAVAGIKRHVEPATLDRDNLTLQQSIVKVDATALQNGGDIVLRLSRR